MADKTKLLFDFKQALSGDGDWFTARLFRLMLKADISNMAKLASVYPDEAQIVADFKAGKLEGIV